MHLPKIGSSDEPSPFRSGKDHGRDVRPSLYGFNDDSQFGERIETEHIGRCRSPRAIEDDDPISALLLYAKMPKPIAHLESPKRNDAYERHAARPRARTPDPERARFARFGLTEAARADGLRRPGPRPVRTESRPHGFVAPPRRRRSAIARDRDTSVRRAAHRAR